MDKGLRWRVFEVLERGRRGDRISQFVDFGLVGLIMLNVAASVMETVPSVAAKHTDAFQAFDRFCVAIFIIEYSARIWAAPEHPIYRGVPELRARLKFLGTPMMIVDFIGILPFFIEIVTGADLRVVRILRIVRFYRLARYVPAIATIIAVIASEWRALLGSTVLFLGLLLFSGVLMYVAEGTVQPDKLGDVPSAMWWAVVTLSTVGYGDVVPVTAAGKVIAALTMILGIMYFALPVGIIASGFQEQIHRRDFVVSFGLVARVPLFAMLDAPTVAELVGRLEARKLTAGQVVFNAGDEADGMYLIATGEVEIELPSGSVRLGEGDFFGEIALLHHEHRRSATVSAVVATELLKLSARDFRRLSMRLPALEETVRTIGEQRLAELTAAKEQKKG